MLDHLQNQYKHLYKGVVLDIGGRDRGKFKKPKNQVKDWIFADINSIHNPDIVLDVAEMSRIESGTIDVVNAIELFEHVKDIEKGFQECYRILKEKGVLIMSIPFLIHIHGDPYDYQRFTLEKLKTLLKKSGFKIEKSIIMGKYFTHLAENLKDLFIALERKKIKGSTFILKLVHPFLDKITKFDKKKIVEQDSRLNFYHTGYFIIAKK